MVQENPSGAQRHLVLAAYGAWGHTRPLCSLAAHLVKARPVYVTLFTPLSFYDRVDAELSRNFDLHEADARAQLRLVGLPPNGQSFLDTESVNAGFEKAYQELVQERPVTCAKTSRQFAAIPSPDAAVLDIFASALTAIIRLHSQKPVKVYGWAVVSASSYHTHFGNASPNKNGDIRSFIYEESKRSGKSIAEVAKQVYFTFKGDVFNLPGLPPMYDYELHPQKMIIDGDLVGMLMLSGAEFTDGCDGMFVATPECFETPETLGGLSDYFGGKVYVVGPMLFTAVDAHATEKSQSEKAQEIDEFMARMLESHGPRSLVYISFGSVWWSTEPEKIWAFVNVLIKRKIPFIFSHASPLAQIPDDVRARVKDSGIGLFSPWSPQQYILSHSVTGWFVTHCGFNSILESVGAGVPMICWPFQADQPVNSMHLTENLDIAYELLEVRTGHGLKPIYRTGKAPAGTLDAIREEANHILDQAFGEDGKKKRAKVEKLQESFAHAWTDKGLSRLALERFLDNLHSA